jgi:hypothetical protein
MATGCGGGAVAAWFPGGAPRLQPDRRLDALQFSRDSPPTVPRVDAGLITYTPCGGRSSPSRARSSRVDHTSDPVPVRRPARVDWASSRPHLAVDARALLLAFGSAHTWHED